MRLDMDLEKLAEPLGQFVDLTSWRIGGQGWAQLALKAGDAGTYRFDTRAAFRNLRFLTLEDPAVEWRARGSWDSANKLHVSDGLVRASDLTVQTNNLEVALTSAGKPLVTGKAVVQGEVARIRHRLRDFLGILPESLNGFLVAHVDLQGRTEPMRATLDAHLTNVVLGPPNAPEWREPKMRIYAQGHYAAEKDLVQLDRLFVQSQALTCDAKGKLTAVTGARNLELQGVFKYDLEKLEPILRKYLGSDARIVANDTHPFHLEGCLSPASPQQATFLGSLSGRAGLSWKSLRAYGGEVGPGQTQLQLAKGWLRTPPFHATLNGGKLLLSPSVRLEPGPAELQLAPGQIVNKARITPAMGSSALGYALPALAGVAQIDGELSIAVDKVRMPLADPRHTELVGKVHIHGARFGATHLVQELGVLLRAPPPVVQIKDCAVPIKMTGGKIYHENLVLIFPDLSVRTSGWVGADGTLSLLAEMPIPEKWLGGGKLSAALAKQTIALPIGGTLERPRLDQQALKAAMTQVVRQTAGKLLQNEIEDRIKKLLPKR